ncbi:hypothetical protein DSL72_007833 [Monilinia vaccinii-corymbosi]|uniref:Uncharacterized protein n=1 Tax=Monilinia vaccinii-corymbosi TaxID=61207 RepID=A0A8A3PJ11_9HELO|nr:hypothetical protein DSL72_007833 [Monilinia vaccinii-corymbosi]
MPLRIPFLSRQSFESLRSPLLKRFETTGAASQKPPEVKLNSRWLGSIKERIGRCIMFGMSREQAREAAKILEILGRDWRELIAGRSGYLVDKNRAGLRRHKRHVNNVSYLRYAESARVHWIQNYAIHIDPQNKEKWSQLCTPEGYGIVMRSIKAGYLFPMTWPDHISVYHKLNYLPSDISAHSASFKLDVLIVSELHQRVAARCEEDIVTYDFKKGQKEVLQPWLLDAFAKTWEEQNAAMASALKKIEAIEEKVRRLEIDTWDRANAVEDMGTATGLIRETLRHGYEAEDQPYHDEGRRLAWLFEKA